MSCNEATDIVNISKVTNIVKFSYRGIKKFQAFDFISSHVCTTNGGLFGFSNKGNIDFKYCFGQFLFLYIYIHIGVYQLLSIFEAEELTTFSI